MWLGGSALAVRTSAVSPGGTPVVSVSPAATVPRAATRDLPWKSTVHKLGLRRSTEQVKPLALSPGSTMSRRANTRAAAPDALSIFYQHLRLLPRAPRGPPALLS
jgi:hypothetical protein